MIAIWPSCKKKRKLMNTFAMNLGEILSVIESEKACCVKCMEEQFWFAHRQAKKEQSQF